MLRYIYIISDPDACFNVEDAIMCFVFKRAPVQNRVFLSDIKEHPPVSALYIVFSFPGIEEALIITLSPGFIST